MKRTELLIIPFVIGVILMVYSWYLSYGLTINSPDDFVFNHISVLYWISQSILLTSMYILGVASKSNFLKWAVSVGVVMTIYSMPYFYSMISGADSQFFRGLTEYSVQTKNLNALQPNHGYYQWPAFFIIADIATSVSGIGLANFEFLIYAIIGFLLATSLHFYAFKASENNSYLVVTAFFISVFYFLNYQYAPFSLALAGLFILFMLETQHKSLSSRLTILILFIGIVFTHAFVPLFFVLYLGIRSFLDRSRQYANLFFLTLTIFFIAQLTLAQFAFAENIIGALSWGSTYSGVVTGTLKPVSVLIDVTAQTLSRIVTIAFITVCVAGFILLLIKRKVRTVDKAILLTGIVYISFGIIFYNLGTRAIPIAFIPISLGVAFLFKGRLRKFLKYFLLVLLLFTVFISIHTSFNNDIQFQTQEAYKAENLMIHYYNWTKTSFILVNFRVITYLQSKLSSEPYLVADPGRVQEADTIFYTEGLGKHFLGENYTLEMLFQEEKLNVVYNNGFSYLAEKAQS